jgi:SAM-dependent methyltransferase
MKQSPKFFGFLALVLLICIIAIALIGNNLASTNIIANDDKDSIYQYKTPPSPDGIGKFYMGREIAQVMGHQGASWLERSSREAEESPNKLISELELKKSDVVADIGAGTGYFSFKISPLLPSGKVLAVDIQPEMIEILELLKREKSISNVQPVLGTISNPNLPESSIDLALMVDAYHEFDHPREMLQNIVKALKPNGRVVLAEYKGENPFIAM